MHEQRDHPFNCLAPVLWAARFMHDADAAWLHRLYKQMINATDAQLVVEIGVWRGASSITMAKELKVHMEVHMAHDTLQSAIHIAHHRMGCPHTTANSHS